jgi:biopolymer transport protein ExbD
MAAKLGHDEEMISDINVTPLVDITLVLLIIFMVTATYIVRETIEVELPRAAHGGETVSRTMALVISKDGKVYLDGQETDEAHLVAEARRSRESGEDVQAIIGADMHAEHGAVVRVLDLLKGAGVLKFAIQIEKSQL